MKFTVVLLTFCCLQLSAKTFAQKIAVSGNGMALEKVFNIIKSQSSYTFFYDYDVLQKCNPVSIDVKDATVEEVLDMVLKGQPLSYKIEGTVIVIGSKELTNQSAGKLRDPVIVKGHVSNESNEALAGAIVTLKGSARVTACNENGDFELRLTPDEAARGVLSISLVGYNKQEIRINKRSFLNIELNKNIRELTDVVITNSYSKPKRKEEVTGSIVTVSSEQLQVNRPIETFDKMLEGLAAGVQVEQSTELGTPVKINIRGQNSISPLSSSNVTQLTTSSQPLFIVDGVPVTEQRKGDEPLAFLNNEQLLNPLSGINPDDIETISILKDAAAAAIYGANASNGVVIITTKKGKAGKTKLNVGYSNGWAQSINKIKWLDGTQYHGLLKEMYINDGRSPFNAELLAGANNINTPWFELVNRYSSKNELYLIMLSMLLSFRTFNNVDVDLSGGNDNTTFRLSGSYLNQQAIQKGNDYEKIYFRLRVDHKVNKRLNMSITMAPTITSKNALNVYSNVPIIPNAPSYNADGSFYKFSTLGVPNPLAILAQNTNNHSGGFEAQAQSTRLLKGSGTGFTYYRLNELSNASNQSSASSRQNATSVSIYGQGTYNLLNKYFATMSGRYDAASIFGNDVNATVNAAVGVGWIINKEALLSDITWIDMLRLRASYGSTGNSRIGSYQARGLYGFNSNGYNGNTSSIPSSAPNAALGWEKNNKSNIGLDFNFIKRFNFTIEFYTNILNDAITPIPVAAQNGFVNVLANIGKMRNRGVDISLNAQVLTGKLTWNTTFNAGFNKNIILEIKNKNSLYGSSSDGTVLKEGISTSAIWGFNFAGVDPATGRELYFDKTGKVVSVFDLDRNIVTGGSYLGDRLPAVQGGFINSFGYKDFTFSINTVYSVGSNILIDNANENNGRNLSNRNQSVNLLDRWQKPGDITNIPLLSAITNPLLYTSSKYMYDNTYIKISNVSVGYTFSKKTFRKLKNTRITIYGNATNLFYWYRHDSPKGRNGIREYKFDFPEAQTFTTGARISI